MVVSLAPVCADEGYIPFFPDFLEPDGIGFRGPARLEVGNIFSEREREFNYGNTGSDPNTPWDTSFYGHPYNDEYHFKGVHQYRSTPITLEYKKIYFFNKLFFYKSIIDIDDYKLDLRLTRKGGSRFSSNDLEHSFFNNFLTQNEISKVIQLNVDELFLETSSKYILFGNIIGIDLWFVELGIGPFLLFQETDIILNGCSSARTLPGQKRYSCNSDRKLYEDSNSGIITKFDQTKLTGIGLGWSVDFTIVLFETDNWRISIEDRLVNQTTQFYDLNLRPLKYRGLNFYSQHNSNNLLYCREFDSDGNCSIGNHMTEESDYTKPFKITYYFQ